MTVLAAALVLAALLLLWAAARSRPHRPAATPRRRPVPGVRPAWKDKPHALYCYPWRDRPGDRYHGIAVDPAGRHARHLKDPRSQRWLPDTAGRMVVVCWYPNYEAAHAAEIAAIVAGALNGEDPANDHHNPNRRIRRAPAPR